MFRVGLSVMLAERNVSPYNLSQMNAERVAKSKKFLKALKENERLTKLFKEIANFSKVIEEVQDEA